MERQISIVLQDQKILQVIRRLLFANWWSLVFHFNQCIQEQCFQIKSYYVGWSCPEGFPYLERHTENNHGDVCRKRKNVKTPGFNINWNCPVGCFGDGDTAPWCKESPYDNSPCRVHSGKLFLSM